MNIELLLRFFPNIFWPLKNFIYKIKINKVGKNFRGFTDATILGLGNIEIGNDVFVGKGANWVSTVGIKIGNGVLFGPETMLIGGNHEFRVVGTPLFLLKSGSKLLPIIIEDDVWVGARVIVMSGVTIGEGSIIGAGAIVTKFQPPYSICVGNPCKPIRPRFDTITDLKSHLEQVSSTYTLQDILHYYGKYGIGEVR